MDEGRFDTNVLISGSFFSGLPARILAAWADGRLELVASIEVLVKYRRVAERLQFLRGLLQAVRSSSSPETVHSWVLPSFGESRC